MHELNIYIQRIITVPFAEIEISQDLFPHKKRLKFPNKIRKHLENKIDLNYICNP
jgi:hypothetical protein